MRVHLPRIQGKTFQKENFVLKMTLDGRGTGVSGTEEEYYENPFYVPADEEVRRKDPKFDDNDGIDI